FPPAAGDRGRTRWRSAGGRLRDWPDHRDLPDELASFSLLKTENRPSLSGRFSCPVWAATRRQASLHILSLPASPCRPMFAGLIAGRVRVLTVSLSRYMVIRELACCRSPGRFSPAAGPLQGPRLAKAPKALRAHHQVIEHF